MRLGVRCERQRSAGVKPSRLGTHLCLPARPCCRPLCCCPADYRFDVSKLEPTVAAPHSPDNRKLARECRDVKIDRVYIGSCTGGKTEDFMTAAKLLHGAGQEVKVPTYLVPATQKVGGHWGDARFFTV